MNQISESTKTVGIFKNPANKKLIELFRSQNRNVLVFPVIAPKKTDLSKKDLKRLENIMIFDWIIFFDIWTVEILLELLEKNEFDLYELDKLRICSNGEAVADSLRFRQIHSDVIPPKNSSKDVFKSISEYAFLEKGVSKTKFLLLKAKERESDLRELLMENSADVVEIGIYEFNNLYKPELSKLKALIYGGAVDEFVFNSPEDVFSFINLVGKDNFRQILSEIKIRAFNEITKQTLLEFDVKFES